MIRLLSFVALAALTVACGQTSASKRQDAPPTAPPADAGTPAETAEKPPSPEQNRLAFLRAMEREVQPMAVRDVQTPLGVFHVEAAGEVQVEDAEKHLTLTIPVGTGSELLCFLHKQSVDAGSMLRAIVASLEDSVKIQLFRPAAIVAAGDRPAVFMELAYVAPDERGNKAIGYVKMMASTTDPSPMVCLHDELGYAKSFQRITTGLAATAPKGAAPRYSEIQVYRIGEVPIGVEHRRIENGAKGELVHTSDSLLMSPTRDGNITFQDTTVETTTDKSGATLKYRHAKAIDGELQLYAELAHQGKGVYQAKGNKAGEPFEATLKTASKTPIASDFQQERQVKAQLLTGKKKELSFETYQPSEDPAALTPVVLRKGEGANAVELESGKLKMSGTVDAEGGFERLRMPLNEEQAIDMQRIFTGGAR